MKRIVLIDADIDLYHITQQNETEVDWGDGVITMTTDIDEAKRIFDAQVSGIVKKVDADEYILCLSGDHNFRKTNFPSYKSNRKVKRKPMGYKELKEYAIANHPHKIYDILEADDVMGIMMTKNQNPEIEYVIHSDDKDMWTIPGNTWDRKKQKIVKQDRLSADRFLYTQVLKGDVTDGYTGCPGVGPKKADEVLKGCTTEKQMREAALKLYVKHYKDEALAKSSMLEQARQARILRSTDYNFQTKEVILWNPWEEENGNEQTIKEV